MIPSIRWQFDDHRGKQVTLVSGFGFFGLRREMGNSSYRAFSRDFETRIDGRPMPLWQKVLYACLPFIAIGVLVFMWYRGSIRPNLWLLMFVPMSVIVFFVFLPRFRQKMIPALIDSYLAHGRCAACQYDLRQIEPEPDGCRVCPECGAAWRIPQAAGVDRTDED